MGEFLFNYNCTKVQRLFSIFLRSSVTLKNVLETHIRNLQQFQKKFQDGFVTWDEYKSEEFDLDENEDEQSIASDPERLEVRGQS